MRLDESHRKWAFSSAGILFISALAYFPYALSYPGGPRGNSLPGLIYGTAGYAMMLYAGLMGARRRVPLWRVGRASAWMRGHLWMGALSFPLIAFHSAFHANGALTFVLMVLLGLTVASGVVGACIQHFAPRLLTDSVPKETIYEQIPRIREQLREEAGAIVGNLCAKQEYVTSASTMDTGRLSAAVVEAETPQLDDEERARLMEIYSSGILPFLRDPEKSSSPLSSASKAAPYFHALRRQSPPSIHDALLDIEEICDETRQLTTQRKMYVWVHAWLLVHVPLSLTLLVLSAIHAFVAIRY